MYANHRRTTVAPEAESCCENKINLHQKQKAMQFVNSLYIDIYLVQQKVKSGEDSWGGLFLKQLFEAIRTNVRPWQWRSDSKPRKWHRVVCVASV